jgi:hypothetical protein
VKFGLYKFCTTEDSWVGTASLKQAEAKGKTDKQSAGPNNQIEPLITIARPSQFSAPMRKAVGCKRPHRGKQNVV